MKTSQKPSARLVDEGEDAGLDLPEMIEALEDQAVTMRISVAAAGRAAGDGV